MNKISRYDLKEKIAETRSSAVYRGEDPGSGEKVIIKILKTAFPSLSEIARFKQEYQLIKKNVHDGVVAIYDYIEQANSIALIFEDFDGISLKEYAAKQQISTATFLNIAISLAETLGTIHSNNIVHRDIKPNNILINPETMAVKITDFGISSEITHKNDEIYNREIIQGTLYYMSPEQTGRMNRNIDYRTDMYSLGVSLYEMLAGHVPFMLNDPLEVIHSHIARKAVPLADLGLQIPVAISDIVMKLLAKNPEERYQNAFGLMEDLKTCALRLEATGTIEPFPLATKDVSMRFQIPQRLIGREREIELLMGSFNRAADGSCEVLLVSGDPGIGKSALIQEINKPIVARRGYFLMGKFEQYRLDVPYSAIIQALLGLVSQILAESRERIGYWKDEILSAVGENGRVIIDVIPDAELIIGPSPDVPALDPAAAQFRFNMVFENFIKVFLKKEHPVALFLDDMQWADQASLVLIKKIIADPGIRYLFLICSYRHAEVTGAHPFRLMLDDFAQKGMAMHDLRLGPINADHINDLIANFLKCDETASRQLAGIIFSKTAGNPFFVNQVLKTLYDSGIIVFDRNKGGWTWDVAQIAGIEITDNVVALLSEKITRLDRDAIDIIKAASCIGNRFDLEILSNITEKPIDLTLSQLNRAIDEGFISFFGDVYRFHHDRILEAAYALISEEGRKQMHYKIGTLVLRNTRPGDIMDSIFYIVNQLNLGRDYIAGEALLELVRLNLMAGVKAKDSVAYGASLKYLETGMALLAAGGDPDGPWRKHYDLFFNLHINTAEVCLLSGMYDRMNAINENILAHAKDLLDVEKVYEIKILSHIARYELMDAVKDGLDILEKLGVKIPLKPSMPRLLFSLLRAKFLVSGKSIGGLASRPDMTDPCTLAVSRILVKIASPALFVSPLMSTLLVILGATLYVRDGYSPESPVLLTNFGIILTGVFNDIETGYALGTLAIDLMKKHNERKYFCRTYEVFNFFIRHWKDYLRLTIDQLLEGYHYGLETGDLEFSGYCGYAYCVNSVLVGMTIPEVEEKTASFMESFSRMNQDIPYHWIKLPYQTLHNLQGKNDDPCVLSGGIYDMRETVPVLEQSKDLATICLIYLVQQFLCVLFNRYDQSLENARVAKKHLLGVMGTYGPVEYNFNLALAHLCHYRQTSLPGRIAARVTVWRAMKKIRRWARYAPMNNRHKYDILKAEWCRIRGDNFKAVEWYMKSITDAHESGFRHEEALACELAGRFFDERGLDDMAAAFLSRAYYHYKQWGAKAKLSQMESIYPRYNMRAALDFPGVLPSADHTSTSSTTITSDNLDISTALKAAYAISGEIVLDRLLRTIMEILLENAGADKGFLLLRTGGRLCIEARGEVGAERIEVLQSIAVEDASDISQSIVGYVSRTARTLIVDDAVHDTRFVGDAYIREKKPKSVLCAPIITQGNLSAVIYLENNLMTGAFVGERLQILSIIASQAAVSIENARLYSNMEGKVNERTMELHDALKKLEAININLLSTNKELERAQYIAKRDMDMAINVQANFLPRTAPESPEWDIAYLFKPMTGISGDFYDFYATSEGLLGAGLFDVSGHGIASGLVTMIAKTVIYQTFLSAPELPLGQILGQANSRLLQEIESVDNYLTGVLVRFAGDAVECVNAGHPEIIMKSGDRVFPVGADNGESIVGHFLGIAGFENDFPVARFTCKKNDVLLLYSDCLAESKNAAGEEYEMERIMESLREGPETSAEELLAHLMDRFFRFVGHGADLSDDLTVVVLKKK